MSKFDSVTVNIKCLTKELDSNESIEFFTNFKEFMREQGYSWAGETGECDDLENGLYRFVEQIHFAKAQ